MTYPEKFVQNFNSAFAVKYRAGANQKA